MEPFGPHEVTWTPVSPRLALSWRTSMLLTFGPIAVIAAVLALVLEFRWLWLAVAGAVVTAAVSWPMIGRQVAAWGYAEREDDLLVRHGLLWRQLVVVPYGRMQYVDVQAGPLDRAFGVARVQLHTASAGTDAKIPGLTPEEAGRLRDRLSSRGQARLAGL